MKKITLEVPAMYADHHVIEVRRLMMEIPGVEDVYASSAFHAVEITCDPEKVDEQLITQVLSEAGYLEELAPPSEIPIAANQDGSQTFFRHTAVFESARQIVSFAQNVPYSGRPLWNCPGFGVIKSRMEE